VSSVYWPEEPGTFRNADFSVGELLGSPDAIVGLSEEGGRSTMPEAERQLRRQAIQPNMIHSPEPVPALPPFAPR
jgi:hypothetical protein